MAVTPPIAGAARSAARKGLTRPASACAVCGSDEIDLDHVRHDGWLELAECARCGHRWTSRVAALPRGTARAVPSVSPSTEVAAAA